MTNSEQPATPVSPSESSPNGSTEAAFGLEAYSLSPVPGVHRQVLILSYTMTPESLRQLGNALAESGAGIMEQADQLEAQMLAGKEAAANLRGPNSTPENSPDSQQSILLVE